MTTTVPWADLKAATEEALADPRPGDEFHEMYSVWIFVMAVEGDLVHGWVFGCHPAEAKEHGRWETWTRRGFVEHTTTSAGPWLLLAKRGSTRASSLWYALGQLTEWADRAREGRRIHRDAIGAERVLWPDRRPAWEPRRAPEPWRPPSAAPYRAGRQ